MALSLKDIKPVSKKRVDKKLPPKKPRNFWEDFEPDESIGLSQQSTPSGVPHVEYSKQSTPNEVLQVEYPKQGTPNKEPQAEYSKRSTPNEVLQTKYSTDELNGLVLRSYSKELNQFDLEVMNLIILFKTDEFFDDKPVYFVNTKTIMSKLNLSKKAVIGRMDKLLKRGDIKIVCRVKNIGTKYILPKYSK